MQEERSSRFSGDPNRSNRSQVIVSPFPRSAQDFREGYHVYVRRFNLDFSPGVVLQSDGLPRNSIQVFGPNAFPAIYGKDGCFLNQVRNRFPDLNINFYRLSDREKEINDELQAILWVERKWRHGPDGVEATEAGLMNGLRRFAEYRFANPLFREPQLMFVNDYFNTHRPEFAAIMINENQHRELFLEDTRSGRTLEYPQSPGRRDSRTHQTHRVPERDEENDFHSKLRSTPSYIGRSSSREDLRERSHDEHHVRLSARYHHRFPREVQEYSRRGRRSHDDHLRSHQPRSSSPRDRVGNRRLRSPLPPQSEQYKESQRYNRNRFGDDNHHEESTVRQPKRSPRGDRWA